MATGIFLIIAGISLVSFGLFMILRKRFKKKGSKEVDIEKTPIFEVDEE